MVKMRKLEVILSSTAAKNKTLSNLVEFFIVQMYNDLEFGSGYVQKARQAAKTTSSSEWMVFFFKLHF